MQLTLPVLIDVFVSTKQTEGKSPKTTLWYKGNLNRFIAWLGGTPRLADFTLQNARAFVAHLQGRTTRYEDHPLSPEKEGGLSVHSIHAYVRTLKVFSSWLVEEGFTPTNALAKLKRPKLPETLIEVLTDAELKAIFASINANCFLGARLSTLITVLLDTGIRAEELLTLTVDNTSIENCTIKVRGKGNKERIVPFGSATKKALMRYLSLWRPQTESNLVFTNMDGGKLSYTALAHSLARLGKRVGIPRLHAHLFRHCFACRYLENGGDVTSLKMLLGHTSIETSMIYVHLSGQYLAGRHSALSPMDKLGR